jgi:hypothetical protein
VGFIFLNGTDSEEERRYTIAHEASHFMLDYLMPRNKAIKKIGCQIEDVLNGSRNATEVELIDSLIKAVHVKPFTHLLEKHGDGSFESLKIFASEINADALALELLAPYHSVVKETTTGRKKVSFYEFEHRCLKILIDKYKLPSSIAKQYSTELAYDITKGPSILDKIRL